MAGYFPVAEAYDGNGYEVARSLLFYNNFRPKRGALELLADRAECLVASLVQDAVNDYKGADL